MSNQLQDQDFSVSFEVTVENDSQPPVDASHVWAALQGMMAVVLVMGLAAAMLHVARGAAMCGEEEQEDEVEYQATRGLALTTPLLRAEHCENC